MKIEIEISDIFVTLIMEDLNIKGETLQDRVQWLWDEITKRLGEIGR